MNTIEVYNLLSDQEKQNLRTKKIRILVQNSIKSGDLNSAKKILVFLRESERLAKKIEHFLITYQKNN